MYIWDALYGKIDFSSLVYKCMFSPEIQRLREVRLCNINSLCITGSSNTNRFEHSVGTAHLAAVNIEATAQNHLKKKKHLLLQRYSMMQQMDRLDIHMNILWKKRALFQSKD